MTVDVEIQVPVHFLQLKKSSISNAAAVMK